MASRKKVYNYGCAHCGRRRGTKSFGKNTGYFIDEKYIPFLKNYEKNTINRLCKCCYTKKPFISTHTISGTDFNTTSNTTCNTISNTTSNTISDTISDTTSNTTSNTISGIISQNISPIYSIKDSSSTNFILQLLMTGGTYTEYFMSLYESNPLAERTFYDYQYSLLPILKSILRNYYSEKIKTIFDSNLVISSDGAWGTKGFNSNTHAYSVINLSSCEVLYIKSLNKKNQINVNGDKCIILMESKDLKMKERSKRKQKFSYKKRKSDLNKKLIIKRGKRISKQKKNIIKGTYFGSKGAIIIGTPEPEQTKIIKKKHTCGNCGANDHIASNKKCPKYQKKK